MDKKITKDAERLLSSLYKEYINKREGGISKENAKLTGSSERIHQDIMSEWSFDDVDETCRELSRAGLLKCFFADDVTYSSYLTDSAISYMENRAKDKLQNLFNNATKLIP